ncbi:hypothetical protein DYY88_02685 [Leptolyngbya iicbica LK]|uniref:Uncharacterized protein n=3 Tax=Cyanophyceae TaxID=3028117 RepID=A0A4V2E3E7_9CYAN|nr:hypothetical protein DYY88_02685 [Leptolyngbya sp. LK]
MPMTLAASAFAEVRRLDAAPSNALPPALMTTATDLQAASPPAIAPPDPSSTPLNPASAPPAPVINVETLTPAAIDYETAGNTLNGTTDPGMAPPARLTPEFDEADFEPPEPLKPAEIPDTVPFEVEDYIPEPTGQSLAEASLEVATPPDDFIQWRATAWGGFMTNNDLEESLTFQGIEVEDSSIFGAGISRTLAGGNTVKIEGELNLLKHSGRQNHWEGTAALALRWEWSPSLSIALIEGVSYATLLPEIEDDNNTDESQFLNYLALEIEYLHSSQWGLAGRIHHRSGAYRQFGDAVGGSNAYIFGLRRRF